MDVVALNILMVTPFFHPLRGGTAYHTHGLTEGLVQRGYKLTLVTPTCWDKPTPASTHGYYKGLEILGVGSFNLPGWPYALKSFTVPYRPFSMVSLIRKLIQEYEIDIVHAQAQKYVWTWIAIGLSHAAGIPSVLTIHGTYGLRFYGGLAMVIEEVFNRSLLRQTLQKASAVICCTELEAGYARRYYEDFEGFIIPNGVNVDEFTDVLNFREEFREEYEIPSDSRVVLFLGSLLSRKGVPELLAAVERVKEAFPDVFFIIVGDGPFWAEVERYANRGLVRAYRWVPDSEKRKLYALSDVFVLPSKSEGQPITLLEAMASGLHIVTTSVGGIAETLAGYGRKTFLNDCSAEGVFDGVSKALDTVSAGSAMDSKTLSYVQRFDWANVTSETEKVYNHVLRA
jgi:glycosyltransferase involved in cell wall biosynthesis